MAHAVVLNLGQGKRNSFLPSLWLATERVGQRSVAGVSPTLMH